MRLLGHHRWVSLLKSMVGRQHIRKETALGLQARVTILTVPDVLFNGGGRGREFEKVAGSASPTLL